jgi:gamma-glutamylcyclotransferase (GGCT)/AIG2-like uncharacterized protein YtfP
VKLIFVYGTLKRGCTNHHYMAGQIFVGEAQTAAGFRLYDLGGFPGMVTQTDDREGVTGEVWSIDDACLARLDVLEGIATGHYRRETVPLLASFADPSIEAYLYPHAITGHPEVGTTWRE